MKYNTVLIGDEMGLLVLEDVIKSYNDFRVRLLIVSEKRDKAVDTGNKIAKRLGCPLLIHPKTRDKRYDNFVRSIELINPDIGIVFSYDRILKKEVLDLFHGQIYNVHGALLPGYRGANVLNWVLINGENKTGVTIHAMVPELDAGAIATQREVEIDECDTAVALQKKLNIVVVELLHAFLSEFLTGSIDLVEQDKEKVTIVRRRKPEDGFFSWNQDARTIYNLIRALVAPWPGAWYIKDGKKYVIDYFISYDEVVKMKKQLQSEE